MEKAKFVLGDSPAFEGYDQGGDWNGWARPTFTWEQADALAAWWKEQPECSAGFDEEMNGYWFDNEAWEEMDSFLPDALEDGTLVWPIGAGVWCWDRTDDE